MRSIAILGGGPGGLFAAHFLQKKLGSEVSVTLFEASSRLGGKVLTRRFDSADVPYEAGVAELYDYSVIGPDPLMKLVTNLGLEPVPMTGPTVILGDRVLRNAADIRRQCGLATLDAIKSFHRECHAKIRPEDYYEGHWEDDNRNPLGRKTFRAYLDQIRDPLARRYIETAVHSDLATEPHQTNALNGIKNVLMDDPHYLNLYSIRGGIEQLTASLAKRISAELLLEHRVTQVEALPQGRYRVHASQPSQSVLREFDQVLIAMPDHWVRTIEFTGDARLAQAMHRHLTRYERPAHYLRVSVLFKKPFWRSVVPGHYFMHDAFGGCCVYDESSRQDSGDFGVLGWLLAGHDAMVRSSFDDATLIRQVLDSLPAPLAAGREQFVEGKVHRWVAALNGQPGGYPQQDPATKHRPGGARHPNLLVVGDYLFDSTLNGVLDSADMVTDILLSEARKQRVAEKIDAEYFDTYDGERSYEESFAEYFDADYTIDQIRTVWGVEPPFALLDVGSASGLTLAEFAKRNVQAEGVENNPQIHALTPAKWLKKNHLADVRDLPFADGSFDFAYETCLCYLPETEVAKAIRELRRVVRVGVFFGGIATDMTEEVIEEHDIFYGVRTLKTLWEWSELFLANGFRLAVTNQRKLQKLWKIETAANEGDHAWYSGLESLRYCFYTRVGS